MSFIRWKRLWALSVGPQTVEILDAERELRLTSGGASHQRRAEAEAKGRKWLDETGAQVLIWGSVEDANKVLQISFLLKEGTLKQEATQRYFLHRDLTLQRNFAEALGDVIAAEAVAAATRASETGSSPAELEA